MVIGSVHPARSIRLKLSLFGASGGAAIAVLVSVHVGSPIENPIPFVLGSALLGGAAAALTTGSARLSRLPLIGAIVIWFVLVALALLYVAAAIALSNFE